MPQPWKPPQKPEGHIVIIGANDLLCSVLDGFSGFLRDNSRILVLDTKKKIKSSGMYSPANLEVSYVPCNIDSYQELSKWIPCHYPENADDNPTVWEFTNSVVILSDFTWKDDEEDNLDESSLHTEMTLADEKTISRLLFIRHLNEAHDSPFSITCEMNLEQNRELAQYTDDEDYIVGNSVTALIMSQLSETRELYPVFSELLSPDGSELYMRPAGQYLDFTEASQNFTFFDMSALVAQKNEVLIGIRVKTPDGKYRQPQLLPPKFDRNHKVIEYSLHPDDLLITIAEQ